MTNTNGRLIVVLAAGLVLAACSQKSPEGAWKTEDGTQVLELLENGDLYWISLDGTRAGRWEVAEKGTLKVIFAQRGPNDAVNCDYTFEKGALILGEDCTIKGRFLRREEGAAGAS